jgi:hypothetical protein
MRHSGEHQYGPSSVPSIAMGTKQRSQFGTPRSSSMTATLRAPVLGLEIRHQGAAPAWGNGVQPPVRQTFPSVT